MGPVQTQLAGLTKTTTAVSFMKPSVAMEAIHSLIASEYLLQKRAVHVEEETITLSTSKHQASAETTLDSSTASVMAVLYTKRKMPAVLHQSLSQTLWGLALKKPAAYVVAVRKPWATSKRWGD